MTYNYADERKRLFTSAGVTTLLHTRTIVDSLLAQAGACEVEAVLAHGLNGDPWLGLACLDYLEELGEIVAINKETAVVRQHLVYKRAQRI